MSSQTRRKFITQIVPVAAALASSTGCRRLRSDHSQINPVAINNLRAKLKGRLILPADPSYETARKVFYWNPATQRAPAVIIQCAHEEDALRAVEFARNHD